MYHFHQKTIIRRYITKNPKIQDNKKLKEIVDWLWKTDKKVLSNGIINQKIG